MIERRYYAHKHLLQENQVHDKICHNFMNIDETVEHMNNQYWKYKQLKEKVAFLEEFIKTGVQYEYYQKIYEENERLKKSVKRQQSSNEECSKYIEELAKENEQLYELIDFANTLFAFKTSESCQKEWEKRLKELKE